MTVSSADPFAAYRPLLLEELRRLVDGIELSHAAVLRDKLADAEADDGRFAAARLCLLTSDALGGDAQIALPAAAALALIESMADVFEEIGAGPEGERPMVERWGMARVLNSGDAFYALAQSSLLSAEGDAAKRVVMLDWLDAASRAVSEELLERAKGPSRASRTQWASLLPAALALGGMAAGEADEAASALVALVGPDDENTAVVPAEARDRIREAIRHIREVEA